MSEPEKTNPSHNQMVAATWAARRLSNAEAKEQGRLFDPEFVDNTFKAIRDRILQDPVELEDTVSRFSAHMTRQAERFRETPESEQEFYRKFPPIPYSPPEGEPIEGSVARPTFDKLCRDDRQAVSVYVTRDMGLADGVAPVRRMKEFRTKCEIVAGDAELLDDARRNVDRDAPRSR